jgi:pyridinium-3,5-bisthiocarboxylic acid mononucleotide nickel chelatase
MKLLYLDCQSGISGDMTLSALIDLGADINYIREHLEKLPIDPFSLNVKQVDKKGIAAKQLELRFDEKVDHTQDHHHHDHSHGHDHHNHSHTDNGHSHGHHHDHHHTHDHGHHHDDHHTHDGHHHHEHRKASTILEMIEKSELPSRVKERSLSVFQVIAEAEGKIHGMDPKDVHFHEVGAMDSIIDVIGVCLALESLEVEKIIASPVPTGHGKLMMAHGLYPIPAPATAEILKGVPLADFHVKGELTTPTGAGFLKALAQEYGNIPPHRIENIGYGAGKKDFEHPNVLRTILFNVEETEQREKITVLECQLDDFTGEALGYLMERLLDRGALDVYFTPVTMKKSRPGNLVTVLATSANSFSLEELLLRETSTFGVRKSEWTRRILARNFHQVETAYGKITVKAGMLEGETIKIYPEYEDVKKAASQHNVSFVDVYSEVQKAAKEQAGN